MTPNQLYQRIPEKSNHDLDALKGFYFDHVPEVNGTLRPTDPTGKVEIRYYKDFNFDHRRFWRLASVWFGPHPVMVIQNAGREGDDWSGRYITDKEKYLWLIEHLNTLLICEDFASATKIVEADNDIPTLTDFYNYKLDGFFDRY